MQLPLTPEALAILERHLVNWAHYEGPIGISWNCIVQSNAQGDITIRLETGYDQVLAVELSWHLLQNVPSLPFLLSLIERQLRPQIVRNSRPAYDGVAYAMGLDTRYSNVHSDFGINLVSLIGGLTKVKTPPMKPAPPSLDRLVSGWDPFAACNG
jgi:hypothetical protein